METKLVFLHFYNKLISEASGIWVPSLDSRPAARLSDFLFKERLRQSSVQQKLGTLFRRGTVILE